MDEDRGSMTGRPCKLCTSTQELRDVAEQARQQGQSLRDIAALLNQHGLDISHVALRRHLQHHAPDRLVPRAEPSRGDVTQRCERIFAGEDIRRALTQIIQVGMSAILEGRVTVSPPVVLNAVKVYHELYGGHTDENTRRIQVLLGIIPEMESRARLTAGKGERIDDAAPVGQEQEVDTLRG